MKDVIRKGLFFRLSIVFFVLITASFSLCDIARAKEEEKPSVSIEAWDCYHDKQFDKAIELFQEEVKLHSDWCDSYDGLGWAYLQKGNFMKAEENFKKSLEKYAYYQNSLAGMQEVIAWKYRRFNRAWSDYYAGNFDKAVSIFNEILADTSDRFPKEELWRVHSGLAWTYFYKKDYDYAIDNFKKVTDTDKKNYDALKGIGLSYYEKGDLDNALKEIKASLDAAEYQPDLRIKMAEIYKKKGDLKNAVGEYKEAEKLNPYLVEPYKGLAWTYYDMGDYEKAKEAFIYGIRIYPGYIADEKFKEILKDRTEWNEIYKILGWSYYYYGLYELAVKEFEEALNMSKSDAEISRGMGYSYYKLGKHDDAIKYFNQSLKGNPNLPAITEYVNIPGTIATYAIKSDAESSLAWSLYYKEEYSDAIKTFENVLEKHPDWIDAHDGLGWAYFMTKDYENAEKAFKSALSFNPSYADALNGLTAISQAKYGKSGLGWTYYFRGDYETALNQFEDVLKGKGADFPEEQLWSIYNGMGWCHYWLGDFSKAEKEFNRVLEEKRDNVDALTGLGYVLFQGKNYKKAMEYLTEALNTAPENYQALTSLGWSYYNTRDYKNSADAFKKAIAINVYLVDPYLGLALSYYRGDDKENAKLVLGTAIDIYPDYIMTDEVKDILKKENDWTDIYSRIGWSYYYKGLFDKASEMFTTVLKMNPSSEDSLLGLGAIFFQQGAYESAVNKLEPLLSKKPSKETGWYKWSYVLNNLAWSCYYNGDYSKALDYFIQVIALHVDDDVYADPYSGVGWCLLKQGDKKGAKEKFLQAIKLAPGYLSALNGLDELDRV